MAEKRRASDVLMQSLKKLMQPSDEQKWEDIRRFLKIRGERDPSALADLAAIDAAMAVTGMENANRETWAAFPEANDAMNRWIPLLSAVDAYGRWSLEEVARATRYEDLPQPDYSAGDKFQFTRESIVRAANYGINMVIEATRDRLQSTGIGSPEQQIYEHYAGHVPDLDRNRAVHGDLIENWDRDGLKALSCGLMAAAEYIKQMEAQADKLLERSDVREEFAKAEIPKVDGNA